MLYVFEYIFYLFLQSTYMYQSWMNPLNKQFTSTMIRAIMLIHATLSTFPNIMYIFHHNNKIHDYDYDYNYE
jgi:hypothetical protein